MIAYGIPNPDDMTKPVPEKEEPKEVK